jgi:DNA-binding NarL/FixJ family response regulator
VGTCPGNCAGALDARGVISSDAMPDDPVRVFVVDDHELFRRTAAAVVQATEGFVVVGTADSFESAEDQLDRVDLALIDVNLPGLSGIEAARVLADRSPRPAVVLLSTYDESTFDWADSGAVDYVAKSSFSPARLLRSWRASRP